MVEATPKVSELKDESKQLGLDSKPGKRWANDLLSGLDARMGAAAKGYRETTKAASVTEADLAVLKSRADETNGRLDGLEDGRGPLQERLEKLQDPENQWKRLPFSDRINEMRIRRASRHLSKHDASMTAARDGAFAATNAYETVSKQRDELDRRRLMHSESMTKAMESTLKVVDERLRPVNEHIEKLETVMKDHEIRTNTAAEKMARLQQMRRGITTKEDMDRYERVRKTFEDQTKDSKKAIKALMVQLESAYAHRERIEADRAIVKTGIDRVASQYAGMVRRPDNAPTPPPVDALPGSTRAPASPSSAVETGRASRDVESIIAELLPETPVGADDIAKVLTERMDDGGSMEGVNLLQDLTDNGIADPGTDSVKWRAALKELCEKLPAFRDRIKDLRGAQEEVAFLDGVVDSAIYKKL